jgi:CubicO group peptidase (beta-lactamase class C family)
MLASRCKNTCSMWRVAPLVLLVLTASGRPAKAADPPPEAIDAVFAEARRPGVPGCAVAVVRAGEFVYKRAYGLADLERNIPLTTRSAFNIASDAKQFTAAVIAHLARSNRLSLDDSLRKHVPELPVHYDPITIRQLVHHTSGIRDYPTLLAMAGLPEVVSEFQFIRLMVRQSALNFAPGSQFLYSNSGYAMLAVVVRRVTGKSLRQYANETLFEPLGMRDTRFQDNRTELIPNRVIPYSPTGQTFRIDGDMADNLLPPQAAAVVGDGGLFTTIDDFVGWARYLEGPFGDELFVRGRLNDGTLLDYAFGLVHVTSPGNIRFVAHGGNTAAYRAAVAHYPEQKLTIATFCNNGALAPQALALRVAELYLPPVPPTSTAMPRPASSAPTGLAAPVVSPDELRQYTGSYYSVELEAPYDVTLADGTLRLTSRAMNVQLQPVAKDRFIWSSWTIQFNRDPSGAVDGYILSGTRASGLRFSRTVSGVR